MSTPVSEPEGMEFAPGPTSIDGKPIRGLFVVATGQDGSGSPAVAIWQIDLTGQPTGAWVTTEAALLDEPDKARQLLACCERRALVADDPTEPMDVLGRIAEAAAVPVDIAAVWGKHPCLLATAVAETRQARATFADAVDTEQHRTGRSLTPIQWSMPLPDTEAVSVTAILRHAQLVAPVGASPVASAALAMSRAVRWCADAWSTTETARSRRAYLRQEFGPAQVAPPSWRQAVVSAYEQVLDL